LGGPVPLRSIVKQTQSHPEVDQKLRALINRRVGWLLLAYLVLRIPVVNALVWVRVIGDYDVVQSLELAAYALTTLMLASARDSFDRYRVDRVSLIAFLLFGTVLRTLPPSEVSDAPTQFFYGFGAIAIVLAVVILRWKRAAPTWAESSWRWLGIGLLVGIGPGLAISAAFSAFRFAVTGELEVVPLAAAPFIAKFVYEMGHSAILEEPAFRGFLWGYLEHRKWQPVTIWQAQALLFWLAHLRYIDQPFTFWIAVPIGGLVFGWLSWKSKSISPGLLAHAAYNSLTSLF
jgi:hypothetical protein